MTAKAILFKDSPAKFDGLRTAIFLYTMAHWSFWRLRSLSLASRLVYWLRRGLCLVRPPSSLCSKSLMERKCLFLHLETWFLVTFRFHFPHAPGLQAPGEWPPDYKAPDYNPQVNGYRIINPTQVNSQVQQSSYFATFLEIWRHSLCNVSGGGWMQPCYPHLSSIPRRPPCISHRLQEQASSCA